MDEALEEIEQAAQWYEAREYGLGESFKESIFTTIDRKLQTDVIIYGPVYNGLSRIFLKPFPYNVYFKKDRKTKVITVFGVLHIKQERSRLDSRI